MAVVEWVVSFQLESTVLCILDPIRRSEVALDDARIRLNDISQHRLVASHASSFDFSALPFDEACETLIRCIANTRLASLSRFISSYYNGTSSFNSNRTVEILCTIASVTRIQPDIQHDFTKRIRLLVERLSETPQNDELHDIISRLFGFCVASMSMRSLYDYAAASTLSASLHAYLQIDGLDRGRENDSRSPISRARLALAKCSEILQARDR